MISKDVFDSRKSFLLQTIIEEYVTTAEPVGSKFLVGKYPMGVSSATIRNDMCLLEQAGYLKAPHPSAGRVPTEKGYQYYLDHFLQINYRPKVEERLRLVLQEKKENEHIMKELAKALVELSGEMIIVAFAPHWSYYTGVSHLFHKPDFTELAQMQTLSDFIDAFDEVIADIFETIPFEPQIFLGKRNPFGKNMSAILMRYSLAQKSQEGLLGLIGPLRMDYSRNLSLVYQTKTLLAKT